MGVFNPQSGTQASVMVGSNIFRFDKFDFEINVKDVAVNNFTSAFQLLVAGLGKAKITCSGPYDPTNMPLVGGNTYTLTLGVSESVTFSAPCMANNIKISDAIEDAARISCDFNSNGSFSLAVT
jgi:hypothetical protein